MHFNEDSSLLFSISIVSMEKIHPDRSHTFSALSLVTHIWRRRRRQLKPCKKSDFQYTIGNYAFMRRWKRFLLLLCFSNDRWVHNYWGENAHTRGIIGAFCRNAIVRKWFALLDGSFMILWTLQTRGYFFRFVVKRKKNILASKINDKR